MVLAQLGGTITRAIRQMNNATIVDQKVLNECLNEINRALLNADVRFQLVRDMHNNVKRIVNFDDLAAGHNKRTIIQQAIFNELCNMLDPGKPSFTPQKGKTSVIMFVGLQGSGKTTTCTKYAYYHQRKGWKPALVCADTFRAGAFDQLKQNAIKAKIPFYGSYAESDPVKIAVEGVETFKKENCDLIIVDTSGRHKQEAALFEEMRQVSEATKPDLIVFVMDSSIGQAAFDQALAFKQSVPVGAVIVTKMDGHAKGGGALSAVAATKSPVIFIGTGEHMDEFDVFDVKPFVSRLLGMGDWSGFMDKIHEVVPEDQQPELLRKLSEGNITLRIMYEYLQNTQKMGPIGQVFSMLPGLSSELMPKDQEVESQAKIKRYMTMMDSMTNEELDSPNAKIMNESRSMRIARGSGCDISEVMEMLEEYKRLAKIWSKMKGLKIPMRRCDMNTRSRNLNAQHVSGVLPPQMLKQIGGRGGLRNLMK
ncbi:signal recognition particle 54 kDa protein 2 [Eucalyptus grandis]|uniref:signal recognition particle 54 kDa protein 2 n=1 Tax=Eucalyptus grandis TaxID=71139 RepID=UPI00192EB108|nr:signal recognition particle 54 kDa protein 2 [Eucalyptus grandis]